MQYLFNFEGFDVYYTQGSGIRKDRDTNEDLEKVLYRIQRTFNYASFGTAIFKRQWVITTDTEIQS